jgi:hypothetical protein
MTQWYDACHPSGEWQSLLSSPASSSKLNCTLSLYPLDNGIEQIEYKSPR